MVEAAKITWMPRRIISVGYIDEMGIPVSAGASTHDIEPVGVIGIRIKAKNEKFEYIRPWHKINWVKQQSDQPD